MLRLMPTPHKEVFVSRTNLTKLRSTLKCKTALQEKAKAADNADAYRRLLTRYCEVVSRFKEILPYVALACRPAFLSEHSAAAVYVHEQGGENNGNNRHQLDENVD